MLLLMGTFVLGWLPSILVYLLLCPACPLAMDPLSVSFFTLLTVSFSLTILKLFSNPFVYALRIAELRRAMWKITLICVCKSSLYRTVSQQSRRRLSSFQIVNEANNCSPLRYRTKITFRIESKIYFKQNSIFSSIERIQLSKKANHRG